jgi:hypothetical protein
MVENTPKTSKASAIPANRGSRKRSIAAVLLEAHTERCRRCRIRALDLKMH